MQQEQLCLSDRVTFKSPRLLAEQQRAAYGKCQPWHPTYVKNARAAKTLTFSQAGVKAFSPKQVSSLGISGHPGSLLETQTFGCSA